MVATLLLVVLQTPSKGEWVQFDVDGKTRKAIIYKPQSVPSGTKPAVYFVFHGLGSNAQLSTTQFDIHELDPNAIVIYPEGIPALPNGFRGSTSASSRQRIERLGGMHTWQIMPKQYEDRDIHFTQAMIKWADAAGADPAKRYYIGHSNGSAFAWVVLKEIGDQFARYVGMNGGTLLPLEGAATRPTLLTTGTYDQLVSSKSVQRFADALAKHNGCGDGTGSPIKTYPGENPVYLFEYESGHLPPKNAYEMAVKFCQTGKPN